MLVRIVDFGLFVLVWLVQLVVYPSFKYYQPEDLMRWHGQYTSAITIVVMPLMLGQLLVHSHGLYCGFSILKLVAFLLVIGTWLVTFLYAVPLHNRINLNNDLQAVVSSLIKVNWIRTIQWSVVFLLGYLNYLNMSKIL